MSVNTGSDPPSDGTRAPRGDAGGDNQRKTRVANEKRAWQEYSGDGRPMRGKRETAGKVATERRAYADRSVHRRSEDASPVSGVQLRAPPRFPPFPRRLGGGGGERRGSGVDVDADRGEDTVTDED
ncbi:hypothetical protein EYF80_036908 [Liparis tanakae]|uniref:Uncharacterized protein n=1 Tax=Liparis tanakae TaxID=230148 RepID=A0A4Z2GI73_9TELE|nr:hypothetical protein EYF80_036908 [Liparis tanakae]